MKNKIHQGILAAIISTTLLSSPAFSEEVRMMWYSDGIEGEVMGDLLDRFMKKNPDIEVILDNVAYKVIQEQLPIALAAGNGPDIARVTNIKAQAQHWLDLTPYLDNVDYWKKSFGDKADWMRPDGSKAITGFMTQLTLTGGYANATLFEQAGIALPGPKATWDEWVEASAQVADSQKLVAAFAIDRSGHRISGPNVSFGANYIGTDGKPSMVDQGTRAFVTKLVNWTKEGKHFRDVWVSAAGTSYRSASEEFINAQVPFYYSGSWQISNLATKIGDDFDWVATGSPCGTDSCSGLAGGAALVAIKYTKHPKAVARVMDYLASAEIVKEFSERTLFIPAHTGLSGRDLNFDTKSEQVKAALAGFMDASANVAPNALALPAWKYASAYYGALATRTSQAMAGELTLDEAFTRMDSDIAEKVK